MKRSRLMTSTMGQFPIEVDGAPRPPIRPPHAEPWLDIQIAPDGPRSLWRVSWGKTR